MKKLLNVCFLATALTFTACSDDKEVKVEIDASKLISATKENVTTEAVVNEVKSENVDSNVEKESKKDEETKFVVENKGRLWDAQDYDEVEIMTYNVENLFNTVHDFDNGEIDRNDYAYLPGTSEEKHHECTSKVTGDFYQKECIETDWTEERLDRKLEQVKRVVDSRIAKPDVLALVEVERAIRSGGDSTVAMKGSIPRDYYRTEVITLLAKKLGYENFCIAGTNDKRGIATAVLYSSTNPKFKKGSEFGCSSIPYPKVAELKEVANPTHEYIKDLSTRQVLEFSFVATNKKIDKNIHLYVNHWPSQGKKPFYRAAMAKKVMDKAKVHLAKNTADNQSDFVVITGDFNTVDKDYPHPFKSYFVNNRTEDGKWAPYNLVDMHASISGQRRYDYLSKLPSGTYFYYRFGNMDWNVLDNFFISNNFLKSSRVNLKSIDYHFKIYAPDFIKHDHLYTNPTEPNFGSLVRGAPTSYDHKLSSDDEGQGYSDHFPIIMRFKVK